MTGYESKKAAAIAKTIDEVNWADHEPNGLAQPAQEPIGYAVPTFDFDNSVIKKVHYARTVPLYTTPPQRPWVGLTDDDWKEIEDMPDTFDQGVAWCLARLKEKNNAT